ncbi:DUF1330 domain-containing protein [Nonomuraea sp. NPDC003201]
MHPSPAGNSIRCSRCRQRNPFHRTSARTSLSHGGRVVAHEAGITQRVVLIEFDSFEQAVAAYESEAYQKALVALPDGVERDFRIIEGID